MQEKQKFDYNKLIGTIILGAMFIGFMYYNNLQAEKKAQQKKLEQKKQDSIKALQDTLVVSDSIQKQVLSDTIISSIDSSSITQQGNNQTITTENDELKITFNTKGAKIESIELKNYKAYNEKDNEHSLPLNLVDSDDVFDIEIPLSSGITLHSKDLLFSYSKNEKDTIQQYIFTTPIESGSLEFVYSLSNGFMIDFQIQSKNLSVKDGALVQWEKVAHSLEKGRSQEMIYTDFHYGYDNYNDDTYDSGTFTEEDEVLNWICVKQQFFLTIFESHDGMKNAQGNITNFEKETHPKLLKDFKYEANIESKGQLNQHFSWYFVPMNLDLLQTYEGKNFDNIVPFDYFNSGIIGWLNKYFFYNIFKWLSNWGIAAGWVIFLMTIIMKLLLSPLTYKMTKQSAMMRVLKPEMEEINEKFKDKDPLKKQQAVMELNRKAGVNPLAGCLPSLLQIPLFMALFRLFPNIIQLRGESFLWADDLTAYDSIIEWTTHIPLLSSIYGNHVSLFALLYAVVLIIYTRMSGSTMQQPTQEGMPNMKFIMYLMPVMFLFFLNSYSSGLSWYYVVSNSINIVLILVIKNFFIDEDKIHAKIQENKKKAPSKKKSKWQQLMEKATEQQKAQQGKKK